MITFLIILSLLLAWLAVVIAIGKCAKEGDPTADYEPHDTEDK